MTSFPCKIDVFLLKCKDYSVHFIPKSSALEVMLSQGMRCCFITNAQAHTGWLKGMQHFPISYPVLANTLHFKNISSDENQELNCSNPKLPLLFESILQTKCTPEQVRTIFALLWINWRLANILETGWTSPRWNPYTKISLWRCLHGQYVSEPPWQNRLNSSYISTETELKHSPRFCCQLLITPLDLNESL